MKNVEMKMEGKKLVITVDTSKDFGPSKNEKIGHMVEQQGLKFLKVGPNNRFDMDSPCCKDGYVFTCKGDYYYGHYSYNNYGGSRSRWILRNLKTGKESSVDVISEVAYWINSDDFGETMLGIIRLLECKIPFTACNLCP